MRLTPRRTSLPPFPGSIHIPNGIRITHYPIALPRRPLVMGEILPTTAQLLGLVLETLFYGEQCC